MSTKRKRRSVRVLAILAGLAATCALIGPPANAATPPPSVTSVTVNTGAISGGTRTVLHGHNFVGVTRVLFGGVPGTRVQVLAPWTLSVYSPAHAAGAVHITVTAAGGTSAKVVADEFRYIPPPTVTVPAPLVSRATQLLRGGPFVSVRKVTIAGQSVAYRVLDSMDLYATVPEVNGLTSTPVQVTTAYGTSKVVQAPVTTPIPYAPAVATASLRGSSDVVLRWAETNENNASYRMMMIRRTVGSTPPATPSDGTLVSNATGFSGTTTDTGVVGSTTYSYAFFAMAAANSWSQPADATVTTPVPGAGWSAPIDETANSFAFTTCEPAAGLCHAISYGQKPGLWLRSSDGTWSWEAPYPPTNNHEIAHMVCSGPNFCVVIIVNNPSVPQAVIYANGTWQPPVDLFNNAAGADTLTCASPTFCLISAGSVWKWNGVTWAQISTPPGPGWASCAAPSWCMVETSSGAYTYDGTTWTLSNNGNAATDSSPGLVGGPISCASPTFCMITSGTSFQDVYDTWNGLTWTAHIDYGLQPATQGRWTLACGSASACVLHAYYPTYPSLAFDGTSWRTYNFVQDSELIANIGCYGNSQCLAMTGTSEYDYTGGP